jgi:hypothetical protein
MVIGTALGWTDTATIVFGYSFTMVPVLRSGLPSVRSSGRRSQPTRCRSR